jgi:hypothetical protein
VALLLTVELLAQSPRPRQYTETELTASKTEQAAGIVEAGAEPGTAARSWISWRARTTTAGRCCCSSSATRGCISSVARTNACEGV